MYKTESIILILITRLLLCMASYLSLGMTCILSEEIDPSKAVSVMKSIESKLSVMKWDFFIGDITTNKNNDQLDNSSVLIDFQTMQYNVDRKMVSSGRREFCSFNGQVYMSYTGKLQSNQNKNKNLVSLGIISKNADDISPSQRIEKNWGTVGIINGIPGMFVPLFSGDDTPSFFSQFMNRWIKEKKVVSVLDNGKGEFNIIVRTKIFDIPYIIYITYNVTKKGIITYTKASPIDESADIKKLSFGEGKVFFELFVTTTQNAQGDWVPQAITYSQPDSKINNTLTYGNFLIKPMVDTSAFVFIFPDGTYVDDQVKKLYYKVGDLIDEDKAIDAFIQYHGLTGNVPRKLTSGGIVRYVLMGTGCLLILIALILKFCKRKQS